jgi:hypothetical protein
MDILILFESTLYRIDISTAGCDRNWDWRYLAVRRRQLPIRFYLAAACFWEIRHEKSNTFPVFPKGRSGTVEILA